MKLGIIGLTNTGKTTLFNALTKVGASTSTYLFSTAKPNIGVVAVPDERLDKLSEIFKPKKTTPAYVEFVDIAGLTKGSGKSEGIGNKFLTYIREVDALIHVVRCFTDENIAYEEKDINPIRDIQTINFELIISDLELVEKRMESIGKKTRNIEPGEKFEAEILKRIKTGLEEEIPARNLSLDESEIKQIKSLGLLTLKPVIYCANISEKDLAAKSQDFELVIKIKDYAKKENSEVISVCAKIEEEISQLNPEDKEVFMNEMKISELSINKLVRASYSLLGYISFLTAGPDEVRAWTIKKGDKAPAAAGKIHSDIERGFIRAEIVAFSDFMDAGGSFAKAKQKGLLRSEGKEYVVEDGNIIEFRFNV
ncbi:MAG: redox-regulated ATPase YchF [Actinomycetota bacterium]|nr:redox-regulated ATPase YchF [Actinomycetota bacterium]